MNIHLGTIGRLRKASVVWFLSAAISFPAIARAATGALYKPNSGPSLTGKHYAAFWGDLSPGEYGVGYSSKWAFDSSRQFTFRGSKLSHRLPGKRPRPVLIDIWYPAQDHSGSRLRLRDYLSIPPLKSLVALSQYLAAENRSVLEGSLSGTAREKQETLKRMLETHVASAVRTKPALGHFPLVIYVHGFGSSTDDNSVLCEWLASHGYVVVTSAFQGEQGEMIGSADDVDGDIDFIIHYADSLSFVDSREIALIGHSGGAQNAIVYVSKHPTRLNALISLDTTEDYHALNFRGHRDYVRDVVTPDITVPMLVAARPEAIFSLMDKCMKSARLYLTIRDLHHEEFISQGVVSDEYGRAGNVKVRHKYKTLCEFMLAFLDASLKRQPKMYQTMLSAFAPPAFETRDLNVEIMPSGASSPPRYDENIWIPPTPRQIHQIASVSGSNSALRLLKKFWRPGSFSPIYAEQFAYSLVDEFLESGRVDDARLISNWYQSAASISVASQYINWGDLSAQLKSPSTAAEFYRRALALDPDNAEATSKLSKLPEKTTK